MELTASIKKSIDETDYETLLCRWRHAPIGEPLLQGESGDYYAKVMRSKRDELSDANRVAASKRVGWK
jgi:hypothetical protein